MLPTEARLQLAVDLDTVDERFPLEPLTIDPGRAAAVAGHVDELVRIASEALAECQRLEAALNAIDRELAGAYVGARELGLVRLILADAGAVR